ncbi:nucleoside recognition domain-containing protein [Paenibacillus sp. J2TS4]|uniref:nucleoside recognition domain-containing protein n=1 Tax=Paenibacillus sp. J2TS4 TaxID=2807194 RepID=UPI001B178E59|nr:nucleoside recognition domain-containing protein [Paenibacillus sp. J2TS4]GIP33002.1 sporulation integral membrane protein YlbJ [Paenibacillus sp. J2TS4]
MRKWIQPDSRSFTILLGGLAVILVLFIIMYPDQVFKSSLNGLTLWWNVVFPGLLPFLILSEMMTGLGLVHALGSLLESAMRWVFRLPGAGGWALALGLTAGFPAGADATGKLIRGRLINAAEAQRLLAVSHLCSPMVMIAVIGVGFLQSAETGFLIAVIHYLSALIMGITLRLLYKDGQANKAPEDRSRSLQNQLGLLRRSAWSMRSAHQEDGRTFGKLLGDSVTSAAQTLLAIGGYIILFSVIHRVLVLAFGPFLAAEPITTYLAGLLDPYLGVFGTSQWSSSPLVQSAVIGAILGWSGFSLHAQTISLAKADGIRYFPFMFARLLHAAYAFILTVLLWKPLTSTFGIIGTSFAPSDMVGASISAKSSTIGAGSFWMEGLRMWPLLGKLYLFIALLIVLLICTSSIIYYICRNKTN